MNYFRQVILFLVFVVFHQRNVGAFVFQTILHNDNKRPLPASTTATDNDILSFGRLDKLEGGNTTISPELVTTDATRLLKTGGILSPYIVAPRTYCRCVPPGSCTQPIPQSSNDGVGQIDVRIVANPFIVAPPDPAFVGPSSNLQCSYQLVGCCQAGSYRCGQRYPAPPGSVAPTSNDQAYFGEFPWQVAILSSGDVYLGSGALVTEQHVLTVAHKVQKIPLSTFKVRVGEWNAANLNEPIPAEDIGIVNVFIHPNFNSANLQNDVAILQLAKTISLNDKSTVGTICLPDANMVNNRQLCYVAGWGKDAFGATGAYQAIQRKVDLRLVTNGVCQASLRRTRLGSAFQLDGNSFLCAGGENGKDACTGDGGSPLVCENTDGTWSVLGLVAWGIGCGTSVVPGVYVNVSNYLSWIQSILSS